MALELKLSTAKATKALRDFDKALAKSQAALKAYNGALAQTSSAAGAMSGAVAGSAGGFRTLSSAAKSSQAALRTTAGSAKQASSSFKEMGKAAGLVRSTLIGLGVSFGGLGIANAVKSTFNAVNAFQQLEGQLKVATNSAQGGANAIAFVKKVAKETATDVTTLAQSYKTFSVNALNSGFKLEQVNDVFEAVAISTRALGLTTEQTKRTFQGFQQIVTKGTFSMEELKQQIGENVPVLPLLAKAMNVTTGELQKMIATGEVGVENLIPLAKVLKDTFGPNLAEALKTPLASLTLIGNAVTNLQTAFGRPMFDAMTDSLKGLADALANFENDNKAAIQAWGTFIGSIAGAGVDAITFLVDNFSALSVVIMPVAGALAALAAIKITAWFVALGAAVVAYGASVAATIARTAALAAALVAQGLAAAAAATGVTTLSGAFRLLLVSMGPLLAIIGAIAAAYALWMVATGQSQTLLQQIGSLIYDLAAALGYSHEEIMQGAAAWMDWAQAIYNNVVGAMEAAQQWMSDLGDSIGDLVTQLGNVAKTVSGVFTSAWNKAKSAATSVIGAIISTVRRLIDIINSAIAALRRLASARSDAGGGGTTAGAKRGGISHKLGAHPRYHVGPDAFVGAPHFADGGVTGGGIPAILHPNEAVIPLKNGAVPVDLGGAVSGGGATDPRSLRMTENLVSNSDTTADGIDKMVDIMADMDDKMQRVVDVVGGKLDKVAQGVNNVMQKISSMGSGGGSAGSGFSGGGGGGSGGGGGGLSSIGVGGAGTGGGTVNVAGIDVKESHPFYEEITGQKRKLTTDIVQDGPLQGMPKDLAKWIIEQSAAGNFALKAKMSGVDWKTVKTAMYGPGPMVPVFQNPGQEAAYWRYKSVEALYQGGDLANWANYLRTGSIPGRFLQVGNTGSAAHHRPGMMQQMLVQGGAAGAGTAWDQSYAKGTPNTSKEKLARAGSGRVAMVHGNEAIIPLTGSRKVPVQLPKRAVDAMSGANNGGQGANNGGVTVNMNVNAKDVDSFRRNKRQMVQEMSREMKAVEREIGQPSDPDLTRSKNTR